MIRHFLKGCYMHIIIDLEVYISRYLITLSFLIHA